ncbi:MAG: DEAD/DEAH box helicase family protein [Deltaproteobacteria bacterium]|nr:DEAD/DEAH box helicase family protein [Deltaproteobacteria bacterium]
MRVRLIPRSWLLDVEGPAEEVRALASVLDARGFPWQCLGEGRELRTLAGALLVLAEEGTLDLGQTLPRPPIDPGQVREALSRLVHEGVLREYQARAVFIGITREKTLLEMPCGSGKTRVAAGLILMGSWIGGLPRWLYVVPNQELAAQARREILQVLARGREILAGSSQTRFAPWQLDCLSYGSLLQRGGRDVDTDGIDGIIVDECHTCGATERFRALLEHGPGKHWDIGMSATPLARQDSRNAWVLGLFGPVAYQVRVADLEQQGYLAKGNPVKI